MIRPVELMLGIMYFVITSEIIAVPSLSFEDLNSDLSVLSDAYQVEEDTSLDELDSIFEQGDNGASNGKTNHKASGFKKLNAAKKRLKGSHDIQDEQGYYGLKGSHALGAYDDKDFYEQADAIAKGSKGIGLNQTRKYRKGSKTRGFHRVHHKDEYKKDKTFYEDDSSSGTLNRFGGQGIAYRSGVGGKIHKGQFYHDLQKGNYGKAGYYDKGSLDKQLAGFSGSQGFDGSFSN